jgi:hypothetical protein
MKPKPFWALNHFTVPMAMLASVHLKEISPLDRLEREKAVAAGGKS